MEEEEEDNMSCIEIMEWWDYILLLVEHIHYLILFAQSCDLLLMVFEYTSYCWYFVAFIKMCIVITSFNLLKLSP